MMDGGEIWGADFTACSSVTMRNVDPWDRVGSGRLLRPRTHNLKREPTDTSGGYRMRLRALLAAGVVAAAGVIAPAAGTPSAQTPPNSGMVRTWNTYALQALGSATNQPPNLAVLHMAMVQGAVYDAVNSIDGGHEPFLAGLPAASPTASMEPRSPPRPIACWTDSAGRRASAAGRRAHDAAGPIRHRVASIPDGTAKTRASSGPGGGGAMLEARDGDGRYVAFPLTVGDEPGAWRPAPPSNGHRPELVDLGGRPRSRCCRRPSSARPDPESQGAANADEYDEVKTLGGGSNSQRNTVQEAIAGFFNVNPVVLFNRTFRTSRQMEGLSLAEDARLFGMLNVAGADALISCWDDKRIRLVLAADHRHPQGRR